jgi:hypothetical protein
MLLGCCAGVDGVLGKDFHDFKIISKAVYEGAHRKEEIRSLILKLSNTMNNFRLSTYEGVVQYLNKEELNILTTVAPTIERLMDGRVRDNITKKKYYLDKLVVYTK